jgi:hypothetical protein
MLAINQCSILFSSLLSTNTKIIYRTIIVPVVLHGHDTWSLTLRVLESRVLRKMLGPKRDEVTGEWRRMNNEELHDLHSSPNVLQVVKSTQKRQVGDVVHMGRGEVCTGFWLGSLRKEVT